MPGATLSVVSSGASYTLSEKCKYVTTAESTSTNGIHGDPLKVFGVDTTEIGAGTDNIVSISVSNDGSGSSAPTVTISGGGGSAGVGTAVVTSNKISSVTVTNTGTGYTSVPTVAIYCAVTFNGASAVNDATEEITLTSHPFATGDQVTYADGGGTTITGLTDGGTVFIIKVDANTVKLASTADNAGAGTAIDITSGVGTGHTLTGETATAVATLGAGGNTGFHAGWVRRTVGTGGRVVEFNTKHLLPLHLLLVTRVMILSLEITNI